MCVQVGRQNVAAGGAPAGGRGDSELREAASGMHELPTGPSAAVDLGLQGADGPRGRACTPDTC